MIVKGEEKRVRENVVTKSRFISRINEKQQKGVVAEYKEQSFLFSKSCWLDWDCLIALWCFTC
jgi:hypothetical protein